MSTATASALWRNPPLVLYHGTTKNHVPSILTSVNFNQGLRSRDFGPGFYTTTSRRQAERWANLKAARFNQVAAVVQFKVDRDEFAMLESLSFVRAGPNANDFWTFVIHCRTQSNPNHSRQGTRKFYDVVIGPVVMKWMSNRVVFRDYDQISVHTQAGADLLNRSHPLELP